MSVQPSVPWPKVPLSLAVEFLDGQRRPVKKADRAHMRGNIPYYGASGVVDYVNDFLFDEDLVLLGEDGENILSRALPLAFKISGKTWVNNHAHVLRPRAPFDIDYLTAYLESLDYALLNSGTAQPKLNKQSCIGVQVTAPPLAVQRRISTALTDSNNLTATLKRLITKKQAIKQGMMQQLLGGRTRLPGFTAPWRDLLLGDVSRIKTGSRNNQDKKASGRYPFFVRSATVERIDSYSYDCEAILVPGEGGIGSIFHYIDGKFEVHQRVYGISHFAADTHGRFVYYYMQQFFGRHAMENSVKATVDSLRLPTFRDFRLTVPEDIQEQRAIAGMLDDASREIDLMRACLAKANAVKQGMTQELLTGRTRLPVREAA